MSFVDVLQGCNQQWDIYIGEDSMDDLSMADVIQENTENNNSVTCPVVDLPWDEYKSWWVSWRRALILRVLGKSFSYKILEPRIKKM